MNRAQRSVLLTTEQWKIRHPEEGSLFLRNEIKPLSHILAHPVQCRVAHMLGTGDQQTQLPLPNGEALHAAFAKELRGRSFESGGPALESDETASTSGFRDGFDLVELLARKRCAARHLQAANPSAGREDRIRNGELGSTESIAGVE